MKRQITDFESKLLDNGWKLLYKTYKGKDSQFVWTYVYGKQFKDFYFKLSLDKKREHTVGIYIENYRVDFLTLEQLQNLNSTYLELSNTIHFLEFGTLLDEFEEIVEIVENENDVDSE